MTRNHLRFLHASDFHLERPLGGLEEVPPALVELALEAPFRAAERVFDAALANQVDFVLLSGDLLQPTAAGPRGLVFLVEQFERLHEKKLPIYWATGRADAGTRWTDVLHLPPNVHLFTGRQVQRAVLEREGRVRVEILGMGAGPERIRPADFHPAGGMLAIALAYGRLESRVVAAQGIHYWALGGDHRRRVLSAATPVVHYPGTPQGRSPKEPGVHGCSLVQVDDHRNLRSRRIVTDSVRWHTETVRLDGTGNRGELERLLESRAHALAAAAPQHELLVRWRVQAPARLAAELQGGKLAAQLLERLRHGFGKRRPGVWSVSLTSEAPAGLPDDWYGEESIRGEFLKSVREYAAPDGAALDFGSFLSEVPAAGVVADAARLDDRKTRRQVAEMASLLGADLLSGEEP